MRNRLVSAFLLVGGLSVVGFSVAQDAPQTKNCEDVFKNIQVFKGVPATELMPMMDFMAASLGMKCSGCHDTKDYSADTFAKGTARRMVEMQRDINKNFFRNRTEVTCMSCHNGSERPNNVPAPDGLSLRHQRVSSPPKAADLFAKFTETVGKAPAMIVRKGTLTSPGDAADHPKVEDVEFDQATGGKFRIVSGDKTIVSDGTKVTFNGSALWGDTKETFVRIGRSWLGADAFADAQGSGVVGTDKIGSTDVTVVRGMSADMNNMTEMYFADKSGLLRRFVNVRRTPLGSFINYIDYDGYKKVGGTQLPMQVDVVFSPTTSWVMKFKSAKVSDTVDESLFKTGD